MERYSKKLFAQQRKLIVNAAEKHLVGLDLPGWELALQASALGFEPGVSHIRRMKLDVVHTKAKCTWAQVGSLADVD